MRIYKRKKPTKHRQFCGYCVGEMNKGEIQVVEEHVNRWGHLEHEYFHPKCALICYISDKKFLHHFKIQYPKPLDAESFLEVFNSKQWQQFRAWYITSPFYALASLHLSDTESKKLLEEVISDVVYKKLFDVAY